MKKLLYPLGLLTLPVFVHAETLGNIPALLKFVGDTINALIPLVIGAAVLVFLWGILKFITAGADEEKRAQARGLMIWGIVGLFVMVSVWGLVNVLRNTFGFNDGGLNTAPPTPKIPGY